MKKLPKGSLKVVEMIPSAVDENTSRLRASVPATVFRPTVRVRMKRRTVEGFGVRIKGEAYVRYELKHFPHPPEFGPHTTRMWIETKDEVEVAESIGELDTDTQEDQSNVE